MRTHSGGRPYACITCGQAFTDSRNLMSHMRTHTSDRPYACTNCGQAFSQSSHLPTDKRTHTGGRPFACTNCAQAFSQFGNLKEHCEKGARSRSGVASAGQRSLVVNCIEACRITIIWGKHSLARNQSERQES